MTLQIIILAAGLGTRMRSTKPKVLHALAGKPMLAHVIETAMSLNPAGIHVVIGHGAVQIQQAMADLPVQWVIQHEQLGTGHAVMQALPQIPLNAQVLVLSADVPLIKSDTLRCLLDDCKPDAEQRMPLGLLVAKVDEPFGLGRMVRDAQGRVEAIVEERDASESQRAIQEIYSGICCASANDFNQWLPALHSGNAQGEYYLTEIIAMAVSQRLPVVSLLVTDATQVQGVNNRMQLQQLERVWQRQMAVQLMASGVTLADASRIDVRGELHCGQDVFIDVNCVFEGKVVVGDGCSIGPNCVLTNVTMGDHCEILANSVLEHCSMENACHVGPFARIRKGTSLATGCKVGNFVEMKNAVVGEGSKASHLSYLGDATIGRQVNIGAGTITCNYDGVNKHQTVIEDGVFIGSDTQLIAPVTVGKNATIGAGSSIRMNVPPDELTLTVSTQKTIYGWVRPKKLGRTKD